MAESITQDLTLTARMELKTYTVTINSGKSNGESQNYTVSHGENWSLPAYPFTPDAGRVFVNYTVNGATKNVGDQIQVTGNLTIVSNLRVTEPVGKTFSFTYWYEQGKDFAIQLNSFDPELAGKTADYVYGTDGVQLSNGLELNTSNIGVRHVPMSGISMSGTPFFTIGIDGFAKISHTGFTSSSGSTLTYTCNR